MSERSFITLSNKKRTRLPKKYQSDDVRFPESLVEYFLEQYTVEGGKILDPFAGFGTTMVVAEQMKRIAFGIEFDQQRCAFARSRLANPDHLLHGDSLKAGSFKILEQDVRFWEDNNKNYSDVMSLGCDRILSDALSE